ncbi:MAG: hypothetical protein WDZ41_05010 [Candidatus Babeliales bacterium]
MKKNLLFLALFAFFNGTILGMDCTKNRKKEKKCEIISKLLPIINSKLQQFESTADTLYFIHRPMQNLVMPLSHMENYQSKSHIFDLNDYPSVEQKAKFFITYNRYNKKDVKLARKVFAFFLGLSPLLLNKPCHFWLESFLECINKLLKTYESTITQLPLSLQEYLFSSMIADLKLLANLPYEMKYTQKGIASERFKEFVASFAHMITLQTKLCETHIQIHRILMPDFSTRSLSIMDFYKKCFDMKNCTNITLNNHETKNTVIANLLAIITYQYQNPHENKQLLSNYIAFLTEKLDNL